MFSTLHSKFTDVRKSSDMPVPRISLLHFFTCPVSNVFLKIHALGKLNFACFKNCFALLSNCYISSICWQLKVHSLIENKLLKQKFTLESFKFCLFKSPFSARFLLQLKVWQLRVEILPCVGRKSHSVSWATFLFPGRFQPFSFVFSRRNLLTKCLALNAPYQGTLIIIPLVLALNKHSAKVRLGTSRKISHIWDFGGR